MLTDEQEAACVYVVNTCEYCLETIPKLHQQIAETIQGFEIDLQDQATVPFRELINTAITALVKSIASKTELAYAPMQKISWL